MLGSGVWSLGGLRVLAMSELRTAGQRSSPTSANELDVDASENSQDGKRYKSETSITRQTSEIVRSSGHKA